MRIHVRHIGMVGALLALLPAWAAAQQGGSVEGRVRDGGTKQVVPNVAVTIVGTRLGTISTDNGSFRINGIPAGRVTVRAQRIGYSPKDTSVDVAEGRTTGIEFVLSARAAQITETIVTAAGTSEQKRETGASVATIAVDSMNKAPINNFSDVLSARTAGVTVQAAGGTAGTGSRIRIRGANSISLSNDPLIIVDGVRLNNNANSMSIGVGGQSPSRFDDINPEDIADIQVIKGPAAAALYGTAAANGVIQITTKRGEAGKTRWTAYATYGPEKNYTDFPSNFRAFGTTPADSLGNTRSVRCTTISQAAGLCTLDSIQSFNPLVAHSPFITGYRNEYGLSASGGSAAATYFLSGDYYREQGVYDPNALRRYNLRANVGAQLNPKFNIQANSHYLHSRVAFPQNDNNLEGLVSGGLLGASADNSNDGYFFVSPDKLFALNTNQDIERFTGGVTANYQPLNWLSAVFTAGIDYTNRYDQFLVVPGIFTPDDGDPDAAVGERASNPFNIWDYTTNASATGTFQLTQNLTSKTHVGLAWERSYTHGTDAFGEQLTIGTKSLNGANALFAVDESSADIITIGGYALEELGWKDRVFVSGGVRTDRNSAFGVDEGWVAYPTVNLSWVLGEEPFFPKQNIVSSIRLRTAYGESGQHPNFRDAVTFFSPLAVTLNSTTEAGLQIGGTGNILLKPELSKEFEIGADLGFFNEHLNAEYTYYHKSTQQALVSQRLAPSLGVSNSRFVNLGQVLNTGHELSLNSTVYQSNPVTVNLTVSGSTNKNKVVNLGNGIAPIIFGLGANTQRFQNGYPLGGYWQQPILGFKDANGDGIISPDEVQVGDTATYLGSPFPTRELSFSPQITFFKYFRVGGLLDYRGGYKLYNGTEDFRCSAIGNCNAINNPHASLADQAAAVADVSDATVAGYIEDATFWKLRELSLTLIAPRGISSKTGFSNLSLTVAGRNLATWTKYKGLDPELNGNAQSNFNQFDFLTQPPIRYWTFRIDMTR